MGRFRCKDSMGFGGPSGNAPGVGVKPQKRAPRRAGGKEEGRKTGRRNRKGSCRRRGGGLEAGRGAENELKRRGKGKERKGVGRGE